MPKAVIVFEVEIGDSWHTNLGVVKRAELIAHDMIEDTDHNVKFLVAAETTNVRDRVAQSRGLGRLEVGGERE